MLGAIIGHQVSDDDKGTAIGAVVGGAAGTGSVGSLELGAPNDVKVRL